MRRGAIAKHCGITAGTDTFIHAYERLGVIEEALTEAWRRRIAFVFLFPQRCAVFVASFWASPGTISEDERFEMVKDAAVVVADPSA